MIKSQPTPPLPGTTAGRLTRDRKEIRSEDLFGDGNEISIIHNGERYSLRVTSNRKLILTK